MKMTLPLMSFVTLSLLLLVRISSAVVTFDLPVPERNPRDCSSYWMYHEEIFGVCAFCSFKVLEGGDTQSFRSACNDPRLGEANYKEVTYLPKDFKYVPRCDETALLPDSVTARCEDWSSMGDHGSGSTITLGGSCEVQCKDGYESALESNITTIQCYNCTTHDQLCQWDIQLPEVLCRSLTPVLTPTAGTVSETDQEEDEENKGLKVWILVCVPVVIAVLLGSVIGVICFIRHRRYFRRKPNSSVEISLTELYVPSNDDAAQAHSLLPPSVNVSNTDCNVNSEDKDAAEGPERHESMDSEKSGDSGYRTLCAAAMPQSSTYPIVNITKNYTYNSVNASNIGTIVAIHQTCGNQLDERALADHYAISSQQDSIPAIDRSSSPEQSCSNELQQCLTATNTVLLNSRDLTVLEDSNIVFTTTGTSLSATAATTVSPTPTDTSTSSAITTNTSTSSTTTTDTSTSSAATADTSIPIKSATTTAVTTVSPTPTDTSTSSTTTTNTSTSSTTTTGTTNNTNTDITTASTTSFSTTNTSTTTAPVDSATAAQSSSSTDKVGLSTAALFPSVDSVLSTEDALSASSRSHSSIQSTHDVKPQCEHALDEVNTDEETLNSKDISFDAQPYANIIQNTAVMNMDRETGPGLSSDDPTRSTPTPDLGITGCNVSFLPAADRDADGCQGDDMSKHAKHSNNSNPTLATINSRCKDSGISTAPSGLLKSHAQVIAPITQIDTTPRTHAPENLEDLYHLHFNLDPHRASLRAYGCDVTDDVTEKFPDQTDTDSQSLPPQVLTATPDSGISPRREVTYTTHGLSRSASPSLPHSDPAMPDVSLHNTDTFVVSQDRFSVEEGSEKHVAELTGVAVAAQQGGSCTSVAENESNLKVAVPVQPSSTKFLPDVEELQRRASPTLPANVEKFEKLRLKNGFSPQHLKTEDTGCLPKHLRHHSAPEGRPCQAFTQPAAANIPEYDSCTSQYTCSDFKGFHPLGGPGDGNFESLQHGAQYSSLGLGSVLGDSPSVPGSPHHRMAPADSPHHRMTPADSPHHRIAPADTVHHRMAPADTVHHRMAPADTVHHRVAPADTVHHHMAPADTVHHHMATADTLHHHMAPADTLQHSLSFDQNYAGLLGPNDQHYNFFAHGAESVYPQFYERIGNRVYRNQIPRSFSQPTPEHPGYRPAPPLYHSQGAYNYRAFFAPNATYKNQRDFPQSLHRQYSLPLPQQRMQIPSSSGTKITAGKVGNFVQSKEVKVYGKPEDLPALISQASLVPDANFEITAETVGDCQSSTRTIVEAN